MHIAIDTMEEKQLSLPTARAVTEALDQVVADGDGELDHSVLVRILEANNPVKVA